MGGGPTTSGAVDRLQIGRLFARRKGRPKQRAGDGHAGPARHVDGQIALPALARLPAEGESGAAGERRGRSDVGGRQV
jgi:hypothetical protein